MLVRPVSEDLLQDRVGTPLAHRHGRTEMVNFSWELVLPRRADKFSLAITTTRPRFRLRGSHAR